MKLPKLHIRDLFWLVLVCALAVGWWVERQRLAAEVERLTLPVTIELRDFVETESPKTDLSK